MASSSSASSSSSSMSSSTGRDFAMEALLDREPHGDFYRACRLVEEAVPGALQARPNLITKAALVQQALALGVPSTCASSTNNNTPLVATAEATAEASDDNNNNHKNDNKDAATTTTAAAAPSWSWKCPLEDALQQARVRQYYSAAQSRPSFQATSTSSGTTDDGNNNKMKNQNRAVANVLRRVLGDNHGDDISGMPPNSDGGGGDDDMITSIRLRSTTPPPTVLHPEASEHSEQPVISPSLSSLGGGGGAGGAGSNNSGSSGNNEDDDDDSAEIATLLQAMVHDWVVDATSSSTCTSSSKTAAMIAAAVAATSNKQNDTTPGKKNARLVNLLRLLLLLADQDASLELAVGPLLALLPVKTSTTTTDSESVAMTADHPNDSVFEEDQEWIRYWGFQAATVQERQEQGRLQQRRSSSGVVASPTSPELSSSSSSPPTVPPPLRPRRRRRRRHVNNNDSNDVAASESVSDSIDDDDSSSSSDSSDEDDDDASSSDDSSSSSDNSETHLRQQQLESDRDDLTDEDDEAILQQAMAIRLDDNNGTANSSSSGRRALPSRADSGGLDIFMSRSIDGSNDDDDEDVVDDGEPNATSVESPVSESHTQDEYEHLNDDDDDADDDEMEDHDTTLNDTTTGTEAADEDDNNAPLAPWPIPPSARPWYVTEAAFNAETAAAAVAAEAADGAGSTGEAAVDDIIMENNKRIGCLPVGRVLVHLVQQLERLVVSPPTSTTTTTAVGSSKGDSAQDSSHNNDIIVHSCVPGGVASNLFPPVEDPPTPSHAAACEDDGMDDDDDATSNGKSPTILLVALIRKLQQRRQSAIQSRLAASGSGTAAASRSRTSQPTDSASSATGGVPEEDDPSMTLAMNYIEHDQHDLSLAALELKGLRRKAAAAAHDAAALAAAASRTLAYNHHRHLDDSECLLRCLGALTGHLMKKATMSSSALSVSNPPPSVSLLPRSVADQLASVLDRMMMQRQPDDGGGNVMEEVFLASRLYRESLRAWTESVPMLYPTAEKLAGLLESTLAACVTSCSGSEEPLPSLDDRKSLPDEAGTNMYKLEALCRRLQAPDLMDRLVARPVPYDSTAVDPVALAAPYRASALVKRLGEALQSSTISSHCTAPVEALYRAICHCIHSRVLLLDGLYATTETPEDSSANTNNSGPVSSPVNDILRVAKSPSSHLWLDHTKCADSIAIQSPLSSNNSGGTTSAAESNSNSTTNSPCVNQRASKVWGTVVSTYSFSPKSGVHQWAVRLDKCERGHVFVGVSTAQANTRTYVGGDKYGWGMIGTQALWHDRRKIRGDYGATFRTGATIIVTLDTGVGALSFGTFRAAEAGSGVYSSTHEEGMVEDWGIAFEGLPLDCLLYPAVGLYQRDDQVTLVDVENPKNLGFNVSGGLSYYPSTQSHPHDVAGVEQVRTFNKKLMDDGNEYCAELLSRVRTGKAAGRDVAIFPAMVASLCLLPPSVPILSGRSALILLPHLRRCLKSLKGESSDYSLRHGKWVIRATSGTNDLEEYLVKLESTEGGFTGSGVGTTGKSKNGSVSIVGTLQGTLLTFAEEWSEETSSSVGDDVSSCIISARLSLDGRHFEGSYRNVQFGTVGQIAGVYYGGDVQGDSVGPLGDELQTGRLLLAAAHSHLASLLSSWPLLPMYFKDGEGSSEFVREALSRSAISGSSLSLSQDKTIASLRSKYFFGGDCPLVGINASHLLNKTKVTVSSSSWSLDEVSGRVYNLDAEMAAKSGGRGSLRSLCPEQYDETRRHIVVALLIATGKFGSVEDTTSLTSTWTAALRVAEDSVREAVASSSGGTKRQACSKVLEVLKLTSDFLINLKPSIEGRESLDDFVWFFCKVKKEADLDCLRETMVLSSGKSVLRLVAVNETLGLFSDLSPTCFQAFEYLAVGIPRLLGRGESSLFSGKGADKLPSEIGGRCTVGLEGADLDVKTALTSAVHNMFKCFAERTMESMAEHQVSSKSTVALDSLALAATACFTGSFRTSYSELADLFLRMIKQFLSNRRSALFETVIHEEEDGRVVSICGLCQRDVSRSVLRYSLASVHIFMHNLLRGDASKSSMTIDTSLDWVRSELEQSLPKIERICSERASQTVDSTAQTEINRFLRTSSKPASERKGKKNKGSAIKFLRDHGLSAVTASHPQQGKSRKSTESSTAQWKKKELSFTGQHLTQWLHALSAILKSPCRRIVASDVRWTVVLFRAVGLDVRTSENTVESIENDVSGGVMPARQRARVLSLLRNLLEVSPPSQVLAEALFVLSGSDAAASVEEKSNHLVAREAVSSLRFLYNPEQKLWRICINQAIKSIVGEDSSVAQAGVVAFLNGTLQGISVLSFVLLKPSVSVPTTHDQQSASSLKSSNAPSARLAPTGTESVACGLLRSSADAGIVSNIDSRGGICEVIFMPRDSDRGHQHAIEHGRRSALGRQSLTVRALRAPLKDVSIGQEFPLFLDDALPTKELIGTMLEGALNSLSSSLADPAAKTQDCFDAMPQPYESKLSRLRLDLMIVRGCISLFAAADIASDFLESPEFRKCRVALLSLACPDLVDADAQPDTVRNILNDSLASLTWRESRYHGIVEALKDLDFRLNSVKKSPISESLLQEQASDKVKPVPSPSKPTETSTTTSPSALPSLEVSDDYVSSSGSTTPPTAGSVLAPRDLDSAQNRSASQSTGGSNSDEDDDEEEEDDGSDTAAAAHLREASIAQMAELGIPRAFSEFALRRTGGTIEAAVHFCLENGTDIERMLADDIARRAPSRESNSTPRGGRNDGHLLRQLLEMGFRRRWCTEALAASGYNVDDALTWILNNNEALERLSDSEDEDAEEDDNGDESDEESEDENEDEEDTLESVDQEDDDKELPVDESFTSWSGASDPLTVISGQASIDETTLDISGLSNGGFASVGMKGLLLKSGRWYYEVVLGTAGCIQVGFGDASFASHCSADRGDGCGDSSSSFSFDGWRRLRWHGMATEWGCRWQKGDTIGCFLDLEKRQISFSLNGQREAVGMGVAFTDFNFCGGLFPVVSFNRREKLRLILGGKQLFKHPPPHGYRGVGEAILDAVNERNAFLTNEQHLLGPVNRDEEQKFFRDLSDEDHGHELFSWPHRYYGSDASVHLGSARSRTAFPRTTSSEVVTPSGLSIRTEKEWTTLPEDSPSSMETKMLQGYMSVRQELCLEVWNESIALGIMLTRKLLLHLVVGGARFDVSWFTADSDNGEVASQKLWRVLEASLALRSWSGEAGTMAIAAEALGLGIQMQSRAQTGSPGSPPTTGSTQVLASICSFPSISDLRSIGESYAAAAEAALGSEDGGAPLAFARDGVQKAARSSCYFRNVLVAAIFRSVRLLAGIDDSSHSGQVQDSEPGEKGANDEDRPRTVQPDARLASFLSGILLSPDVAGAASDDEAIYKNVFVAWSIGMLSGSLPWRMVCAFTAAGILNLKPEIFGGAIHSYPILAKMYGRLESTTARRVWAERAAFPVCSRYVQALIELLAAVKHATNVSKNLPAGFSKYWGNVDVEAACPLPLCIEQCKGSNWEQASGWIPCGEVWVGKLVHTEVRWKKPQRSAVRSLMEGGEGPPMLRVGCRVVRGPDWDSGSYGSSDGRDVYEAAKAKRAAALSVEGSAQDTSNLEESKKQTFDVSGSAEPEEESPPADVPENDLFESKEKRESAKDTKKKLKKKFPAPKLALGTVASIERWAGLHAQGRKVKWDLSGEERVYRFGGDGGKHDLVHVEVNAKETKILKRHPFPETDEQCASRWGFGSEKVFSALLRIRPDTKGDGNSALGILELPDFGAAVKVKCTFNEDGSVTIEEQDLIFGSRDSGWEARFGQPSYVSGTAYTLTQAQAVSTPPDYETMSGKTEFHVDRLRNSRDGQKISVESELYFTKSASKPFEYPESAPAPLTFDSDFHAANLTVSRDGKTVTCTSSDGRGTAFASTGFSKGMHYWEVKLEQADIGSVFIGVSEKPQPDVAPRLSRWNGWGFVNFRATYSNGSERVYGVHAHAGDTVGVLLDCDAGRLSFFYDGLKYGEHILNDLGCAFENLSPFGFSAEGCGSGGAGQSAQGGFSRTSAQGFVRPKTLWPVIGLRNQGDRVTILPKWSTRYGADGVTVLRNVLAIDELLRDYEKGQTPTWFLEEVFAEYGKWKAGNSSHTTSRGTGPLQVEVDTSPLGCAAASAMLGIQHALLPGDRIRLKRSCGRKLELTEEAVIIGQSQQRLWYKIVAQKNEGQSLAEGADKPHWLEECDVVDGIDFVNQAKGRDVPLPRLNRFTCPSKHGLKVVYASGAVIRSDLEINDQSENLGTIPKNTSIPAQNVLERRVNSCGVVRYRVQYESLQGYISATIRGGSEEAIVELVQDNEGDQDQPLVVESNDRRCSTPLECAEVWHEAWALGNKIEGDGDFDIPDTEALKLLLGRGSFGNMAQHDSDTLLTRCMDQICNFVPNGDALEASFVEVRSALSFALNTNTEDEPSLVSNAGMKEAVASVLRLTNEETIPVPSVPSILARLAFLRAFNRRLRLAVPWMSIRPCQEGSAMLGGICGYGTGTDKAGRTRLLDSDAAKSWVQVPSIAARVRSLRGLIFGSVKRSVLASITDNTTTSTPLSHDEYELPREIRTVRINRLKAARAIATNSTSKKKKHSVFSQLQNETKSWGGGGLRRGYVAKGHGGQKRAFKVKFVGEGVNDYSGPYREVFADAFAELLVVDPNHEDRGALGVLDPTPNNASAIGDNRELYMFSLNGQTLSDLQQRLNAASTGSAEQRLRECFMSVLTPRNEPSREVEEFLVFLGRVVGTAYRHGIATDLPLPMETVWKAIVEEGTGTETERLEELDYLAARPQVHGNHDRSLLLWWQQRMLNAFMEGLSNVIPVEILPVFTGDELRDTFCGNPHVDVELLQRVVEYEGYEESDDIVRYLWETLRSFTNDERKQFLQFVWARNRLPMRESEFESPFKVQKDASNTADKADLALPSASTCFFSLTLPEYSSAEILREKLLYAITNVTTMETDFQTNSAEIAEGYRAL